MQRRSVMPFMVIVSLFSLLMPFRAWSQEKTLYRFAGYPSDGEYPNGSLVADQQGNLYGTTGVGGTYQYGTVFELKPGAGGGWTESILYSFAGTPDGAYPSGGVILDSAGNLYGVTSDGGSNQSLFTSGGIVYELSPPQDGETEWTETIIFDFTTLDYAGGGNPNGHLVFDAAGNLYGAAGTGGGGDADYCGDTGCGTIFELQPPSSSGDQWTYIDIHDFLVIPHTDGFGPRQVLMGSDGVLYGYSNYGAEWIQSLHEYASFEGAIFRLSPPSAGGIQWNEQEIALMEGTNGNYPNGMSIAANGDLFVDMLQGGSSNNGIVLQMTPTQTGWVQTDIYNFTGGADGRGPNGAPFLSTKGDIYVMAASGGTHECNSTSDNCGAFIHLSPNGDGAYTEQTIYDFDQSSGASPNGGLLLHDGFLVGTASLGGTTTGQGNGTVFEVKP
jgi:uncharacterized repeat protein (TIGR03803 family)